MKKHITSIIAFLGSLMRPVEILANEAKEAASEFFFVNQFLPDKDNWVQLSPFGDFANRDRKGKTVIQRFRKEDAEEICNNFNGIARKIRQPLGMPFFVGHPDHPAFAGKAGHNDTASKGRGKAMEARHDANCSVCREFANTKQPCPDHGLFVKMDWNPHGSEIIANQEYHGHSVNWSAVPDGIENGVQIFRPISVKSTGFTNEPAIPVAPITMANAEQVEDTSELQVANATLTTERDEARAGCLKFEIALAEAMGVLLGNAETLKDDPDAKEDHADFISWLHSLLGTDPKEGVEPLKAALNDKIEKAGALDRVKKARTAVEEAHKRHSKASQALEEKLANARRNAATIAVDGLIKSGHILSADKETRITELANAEDIAAATAALANAKPIIKTTARTANLAGKKVSLKETSSRTAAFSDLMVKRAEQFPNEDYATRFKAVGESDEGKVLMAQMKRPGGEEE